MLPIWALLFKIFLTITDSWVKVILVDLFSAKQYLKKWDTIFCLLQKVIKTDVRKYFIIAKKAISMLGIHLPNPKDVEMFHSLAAFLSACLC